jgi:hypothetical protein
MTERPAQVIDFAARRFCAQIMRRIEVAMLEQQVALLSHRLGKIGGAALWDAQCRGVIVCVEAQDAIDEFEGAA